MTTPGDDAQHQTLFLAMYWSGGGPHTISSMIGACDWIARIILTKSELEDAINCLLAAGLIEWEPGGFRISPEAYADFGSFLRRRKRNKFDAVEQYFGMLHPIDSVTAEFRLTDEEYGAHLSEYRKAVRDALAKLPRGRS